jgi:Tfp pilus assembly protein PilN
MIAPASTVVGVLVIFVLATVGLVMVGVCTYLGAMMLIRQLQRIDQADEIIALQQERDKLEQMVAGVA